MDLLFRVLEQDLSHKSSVVKAQSKQTAMAMKT